MSNQIFSDIAGVIVCGGKSTRMGSDKASLMFDGQSMLERVTKKLSMIFETIVVVAAQAQELPALTVDCIIARDKTEGQGPLEGIRSGLNAMPQTCHAAYVSSCDVPMLQVDFVRTVVEQLREFDIAVPEANGFKHPMAAIYRRRLVTEIDQMIKQQRLRPAFLFDRFQTNVISQEILESADPLLYSLINLNSPGDLEKALEIARANSQP